MKIQGYSLLMLCLAACMSVGFAREARKIVNGQGAWEGLIPHQVSLQVGNHHFCGGSILDETNILTAAHCIVNDDHTMMNAQDIQVVTGIVDRFNRHRGNVFQVSKIIRHKDYSFEPDFLNDIAILKLAQPIQFNYFQKKVNLPTKDTPGGTRATASGWGRFDGDINELPRYLQKLNVIVTSPSECQSFYRREIVPGQICARNNVGGGMCNGDSGGPLSTGNEVIGIASWVAVAASGKACGIGTPDVYTRVYRYVPWIQQVLRLPS